MKPARILVALLLAVVFAFAAVAPAAAGEGALSTVFNDAWYGGLTGALVATAVVVFTDDPGDHLEWILYGAAGGVLVGAAIGLADSTTSFAEVRDGRVALAVPTPVPTAERGPDGRVALGVRADLLRARF